MEIIISVISHESFLRNLPTRSKLEFLSISAVRRTELTKEAKITVKSATKLGYSLPLSRSPCVSRSFSGVGFKSNFLVSWTDTYIDWWEPSLSKCIRSRSAAMHIQALLRTTRTLRITGKCESNFLINSREYFTERFDPDTEIFSGPFASTSKLRSHTKDFTPISCFLRRSRLFWILLTRLEWKPLCTCHK